MAYSDEDLSSAVAAGAIAPEAADALRAHVSRSRDMSRGDEESFRLVNSFNDIFVAIGVVILLIAVGAIGNTIAGVIAPFQTDAEFMAPFGNHLPSIAEEDARDAARAIHSGWSWLLSGTLIAFTAWPLAEIFTRKRRLALPSIILLLAFVGGVFAATIGAGNVLSPSDDVGAVLISVSGLISAGAAWLHWRRFMVPITVATGVASVAITFIGLLTGLYVSITEDSPTDFLLMALLVSGLVIFALAMRWDMSDRERVTRRHDVAFWLHLLAAPMIAHPVFYSLGIMDGAQNSIGTAIAVLLMYLAFGIVALAINRRAMLVSALAYVLVALAYLFSEFGALELNFALTAFVIGSALLTLSAYWSPIRATIVNRLPQGLQKKLPETGEF